MKSSSTASAVIIARSAVSGYILRIVHVSILTARDKILRVHCDVSYTSGSSLVCVFAASQN